MADDPSGLDPTAWFIQAARDHPPELLRTAAYVWTGGAEGIVAPGDLRVSALDAAGGQVRISPGAAVVRNRHPEARSESYVIRAPGFCYVDIPATTSPRVDLIGLRIDDPQYEGVNGPDNETEAETWRFTRPFRVHNVSGANLALAQRGQLDLGFPHYFPAYVQLPANTGIGANAVTNAMIGSLRELAQPRSKPVIEIGQPTPEDALTGGLSELGRPWPDYRPDIRVPTWATNATTIVTLSSIGQRVGAAQGYFTAVLGGLRATNIGFDLDAPATGGSRHTLVVAGGFDVRSLAGRTVQIQTEARKLLAAENPGHLVTVAGTQVIYNVIFYEVAS